MKSQVKMAPIEISVKSEPPLFTLKIPYNIFLELQHRLKILEMQISDQMFQNLIGFGTDVINIIIVWRFVEQKLQ